MVLREVAGWYDEEWHLRGPRFEIRNEGYGAVRIPVPQS